jgi:hypothetical protein
MLGRETNPAWRLAKLLKAVKKNQRPKDEYLGNLFDVLTGCVQDDEISYALDLVRVREHKEALLAFFLCNSTLKHVSTVLSIETSVLEHVRDLILDPSVFRNKLERFSYARELVENKKALTDKGREYIKAGLIHGPEILGQHFALGDEEDTINPKKLVEHFIKTAYYLSANARGNSVTAETTKQARMWMLDVLKYFDAYKDWQGGINDGDEALVAIEKRKATISADELGISPDEIYH